MSKVEEILLKQLESFESWEKAEREKIAESEEIIQSEQELVAARKAAVDAKSEQMQIFRALLQALREEREEQHKAAKIYVESLSGEVQANAQSFCAALGIEIEEIAEENESEDEEELQPLAIGAT